jgi:hypothetical protein
MSFTTLQRQTTKTDNNINATRNTQPEQPLSRYEAPVCDEVVPVAVAVAILSPPNLDGLVVESIAFPVQADFQAIDYSMKWMMPY